jgi:formylmethanofuran dehydrogenase subunit A
MDGLPEPVTVQYGLYARMDRTAAVEGAIGALLSRVLHEEKRD